MSVSFVSVFSVSVFVFFILFFIFLFLFVFPRFSILRSTGVAADGRQKDEMIVGSSK